MQPMRRNPAALRLPDSRPPAARQSDPAAVELAADAAEFYDALQELLRAAQFRDREQICCYDISVTECYSLEALDRHGPLMLNQLAAELRLDKSTASRVAAALEAKGYVSREEEPADRRALRLHLTPRGDALHRRVRRDIEGRHAALLAALDPAARHAATSLLRRLAGDLRCVGGGAGTAAGSGCGPGCGSPAGG
ncbi:MAG TPA: MarR family transcriptional regulator [Thermoanaerobaculia bacterium]|nr:MarR family transcriptional regulator [Thermoanaerobaculia bacterium]